MKIFWDAVTLTNLGYEVAQIIQERTLKGIDKDGNTFKPYSTRPFAMPAAAMPRTTLKKLSSKQRIKYGATSFFRKKDLLWVVISRGYKEYKKIRFPAYRKGANPDLWATGEMWGAFGVLGTTPNGVKLGFNTPRSAMIMKYNQDKGRDPLGFQLSELSQKALEYLSDIRIVL